MSDKEFRICSRAQGLRVNYGHFDLLWGRDAPDEIYPLVEQWLARRVNRRDGMEALAERAGEKAGDDTGFAISS